VYVEWQSESPYSVADAKRICGEILASAKRPTALLCGNDVIAQGAIFAAQQIGLNLPLDLSLVGIGDFKGSNEIIPPLTTIRIPAKQIGAQAGSALIAKNVRSG